MDGKLVNAYVHNSSAKSAFSGFEIVTCREIPDYDGGTVIETVKTAEEYLNADEIALDEPFYRIFGIYKPKTWMEKYGYDNYIEKKRVIGDFYNIKEAVKFLEELTGNSTNIYSI